MGLRATGTEYVDLGDVLDGSSRMTVTFRIKRGTLGTRQETISKDPPSGLTGWGIGLRAANDIQFTVRDGSSATILNSVTTITSTTEWVDVACVVDGAAGLLRTYIEGVETATISGGLNIAPNTTSLNFFRKPNGTRYCDAALDDIRIYDRALRPTEIQTIHTLKGKDGIVYGLQGRWMLNERLSTQPFFVGVTEVTVGSGTSITLPVHGGVLDDDLLFVAVTPMGDASGVPANVTTPSGWLLLNPTDTDLPSTFSTPSLWVYAREASSEPTDYTFPINQTCSIAGGMVAYRHISPSPAIISPLNTGTSTQAISPSLNAGNYPLSIRVCAADNNAITLNSFAITHRVNLSVTGIGNGGKLRVDDGETKPITGEEAFNLSSSEQWGALTVAFIGGRPVRDISGNDYHGRTVNDPQYVADNTTERR